MNHGVTRDPVLAVRDLSVCYGTLRGEVRAVRNVTFEIGSGETLGIVGESGCGKSSAAFAIVDFLGANGRIAGGQVRFQGTDLVSCPQEERRALLGNRIAMVYQDPAQALNPSLRIGVQLAEALTAHQRLGETAAEKRCLQMLDRVCMPDPPSVMRRYPHQLSGGQQQRVVIAMALLNDPKLLIMDEPTTSLDVTVEATILDLVADLQSDFHTAIMYITHNLGVIARVADRVAVMYAGEILEQGEVGEVFLRPQHPYTQGLLRCVPRAGQDKQRSQLQPIRGRVPSPGQLPVGCVFEPRCDYAQPDCRHSRPVLRAMQAGPDCAVHEARCLFAGQLSERTVLAPSRPAPPEPAQPPLLEIRNARTYYSQPARGLLGRRIEPVKAVDEVSFAVTKGTTLGIVGESGCGKSTLVKTIIGLEKSTGGEFEFLGIDIGRPVGRRSLEVIRNLQMVFQNPDSTLNPSFKVGTQIEWPLRRFKTVPRHEVRAEAIRLLGLMKLGEQYYDRLPVQLSGGEKQRVGIARAIAGRPDLVLCDEPVSSLDVSVQAAVLELLLEIQANLSTTLIFISHDLSVVRFLCDEIAVMYLGRLVEIGPADAIYAPPYHPYTEALLSAIPVPDPTISQKRIRLEGAVPSATKPPSGCHFHTRCPRILGEICREERPPWQEVSGRHLICCHIPLRELRAMGAVLSPASEQPPCQNSVREPQ